MTGQDRHGRQTCKKGECVKMERVTGRHKRTKRKDGKNHRQTERETCKKRRKWKDGKNHRQTCSKWERAGERVGEEADRQVAIKDRSPKKEREDTRTNMHKRRDTEIGLERKRSEREWDGSREPQKREIKEKKTRKQRE